MSASEQAPTAGRRTRLPIRAVILVATAAIIGVVIHQLSAPSFPVVSSGDTRHGALGEAHGVVPDGVKVFDGVPAVANLDPELLGALRRAATDAADDGVEFFVNSGWRSPEYQAELLHEAVSKYGSERGAEYGLCQIYRNELWHYELRPGAVDHGCPPKYADPTHDPRTQQ